MRNIQGIILVFDLTNRKSFDNIKEWLTLIEENYDNKIIILFGNKVDVIKEKCEVNHEEIERFVEEQKLEYFNISAKYREGFYKGFINLANKIYDKRKKNLNY